MCCACRTTTRARALSHRNGAIWVGVVCVSEITYILCVLLLLWCLYTRDYHRIVIVIIHITSPTHNQLISNARQAGGGVCVACAPHSSLHIYTTMHYCVRFLFGPPLLLHKPTTNKQTHRPQVERHYPPNLSILISGGKETNRDSLSSGERSGKSPSSESGSPESQINK